MVAGALIPIGAQALHKGFMAWKLGRAGVFAGWATKSAGIGGAGLMLGSALGIGITGIPILGDLIEWIDDNIYDFPFIDEDDDIDAIRAMARMLQEAEESGTLGPAKPFMNRRTGDMVHPNFLVIEGISPEYPGPVTMNRTFSHFGRAYVKAAVGNQRHRGQQKTYRKKR